MDPDEMKAAMAAAAEKHAAFKKTVAESMGMGDAAHEASEDQIIEAIKTKLAALEKLQSAAEASAKATADAEADKVAAAAGMDDAEKAACRDLRSSNPKLFSALYGKHLVAKPAPAAPAARVDADTANALATPVAQMSAAGASAVPATEVTNKQAELNAKAATGATTLMRQENKPWSNNYVAALKEAISRVARGETIA